MNNVMTYRGYTARVEFDPRDNIFVGRVIGISETITFHGETVTKLTKDFHAAVNHYLMLRSERLRFELDKLSISCVQSRQVDL